MERKKPRQYTEEFKLQMVQLYHSGKPSSEIIREYELTPSVFYNWIRRHSQSGAFSAAESRTPEEKELIELRKQNKQLLMENDILKQAALIMGRK